MNKPARFALKLIPNAGRTEFAGKAGDGAYRIRVQAPPVDGAANKALIAFLAGELGVPKSAVEIVRGQSGRHKTVAIEGDPGELTRIMESKVS